MQDTESRTKETSAFPGDLNPQPPVAPDFPEGGLWGWLAVAGGTLIQYVSLGYTSAFGVYQDYYIRTYLTNYSPSEIGWIGGTQIFFTFSTGIFVGQAFDRGYFYHLMIATALLHALALFTLSVSHENQYYQVFLSQGVCLGLSNGLCYIPSLSVVSHYFYRQRPLAMGIVAAGAALGAVLHPIMLNKLFNGPVGFHNGVRASAALNTSLLIIVILITRTRLPPKKTGPVVPIKEFITDPAYVLLVLGGMLYFFGMFYPMFYLQTNAIKHGLDPNFSFYSLSILNAASILGRTVPLSFAPRFGVFNVFVFFTTISGVTICTMSLVHDVAGTALFAIAYGFTSGAAIATTAPAVAVVSKDTSEIGARLGIMFGICGIVGLFAPPISGALLTNSFDWLAASLFSGLIIVGSGCFGLASRWFIARRKGTQIV